MNRKLKTWALSWPMKEPFVIARGSQDTAEVAVVELESGGCTGRGEAAGIPYRGETPDSLMREIEQVRPAIEAGADRDDLLRLLPAGGARNALDAALWDLEAKLTGLRAWQRAGMDHGAPVISAVTIGIRSIAAYERAAQALADHPWIKIKVDRTDPVAAVTAVRQSGLEYRRAADLRTDHGRTWRRPAGAARRPEPG